MKAMILLIISLVLINCSADTERASKVETSPILETQLNALEKARGVEQSLEEAAKKREKAMREAGT